MNNPAAANPIILQESAVKCRCKQPQCQTKIGTRMIGRWIRRVQCPPPCSNPECRGRLTSAPRKIRWRMIKWPRSISSPRVVNIEDLRKQAQQRLPRAVFDYLDG